jgi:signal transduction histidine kinase
MTPVRTQHARRFAAYTTGARLFALLVLAPPVAFSQDYPTIVSSLLIGAIWLGATFADSLPRLNLRVALVVETTLITFLVTSSLPFTTVLVPALVIPPFIGGVNRGVRGAFEALGVHVAVLLLTVAITPSLQVSAELLATLFTWDMAGLGCGLMGAVIRAAKLEAGARTVSSYRDARALLTQLLELSDNLDAGLDPVTISQRITTQACEEIPLVGVVVHTRSTDGTVTVIDGVDADVLPYELDDLLERAFETGDPAYDGTTVALPLATDAGVVAVLTGDLAPGIDPERIGLAKVLDSVAQSLRSEALKLDTALLFSAVRDSATVEERRRLAREMHDGVAQDLASFGYLIDDALASADSPAQATRLRELRAELSSVVTELRRSVFSLRQEHGRSLGESIADLASHIEARTGIAVEVIRDEGRGRLRPEVESELLRIAQEAMNNAVKHARGTWIRVTCYVRAPQAQVTVQDDGVGLGPGRTDSHGLRIMSERARRIGADIDVTDIGSGTLVQVTLGPSEGSTPTPAPTSAATSLEGSRP